MKSLMLLLGACMIIILMAAVIEGIQDFRSEDYEEAHASVATAAGVTSANITLTNDLFGDRIQEVNSVASSLATDVPLVISYTASSNYLLVSGLTASGNRTITVDYKTGRLDDFFAADIAARSWMMFLVLGIIGVVAAAVYQATRRE